MEKQKERQFDNHIPFLDEYTKMEQLWTIQAWYRRLSC